MDICGIWKVRELRMPTPDGVKVYTPENLPPEDDEMYEDLVQLTQFRTEIAEDGILNTLMFVPEEMKAEAVKHGVTVREDGYAVVESTVWKEENGKYYYDSRITGEFLGEETDPFIELGITEDGCLLYNMGITLLERA